MWNIDPLECISAEQAVLACSLKDKDAFRTARRLMEGQYFYLPLHRRLFSLLEALHAETDPKPTFGRLVELGLEETAFNRTYVEDLERLVGTEVVLSHVAYYATIAAEHFRWHALLEVSKTLDP